jgi:hypothetical protein
MPMTRGQRRSYQRRKFIREQLIPWFAIGIISFCFALMVLEYLVGCGEYYITSSGERVYYQCLVFPTKTPSQ